MSFKNIKPGLVMMAVFSIWGVSMVIALLLSVVMAPFIPSGMSDQLLDYLETVSETNSTETDINNARDNLWNDFGGTITVQYVLQWTLVAFAIFWVSGRTGRQAESTQQAAGYGVLIALGVMLTYGLLCACAPAMIMGTTTLVMIAGMFLTLFVAAGYYGGRSANLSASPRVAGGPTAPGRTPHSPYGQGTQDPFGMGTLASTMTDGVRPETYYNMGVQAAMGGRREEARQHFTRVLQIQPRNIAAWLQMANLADTPDQAWNYVQQARSINPADPAVLDAVNVIWPQVAASSAQRNVPHSKPAYPGGQQDDTEIPRVRLPGSPLDAAPSQPEQAPDKSASDKSAPDESAPDTSAAEEDSSDADQPPVPPPPPPASEL